MAKFRFGLETLLRHREDIEQKEQDELHRRTYRYQIELRNRDTLTARLQETRKELSLKQSENALQKELDYYYRYCARLAHEIGESKKRLAQLQTDVQLQRAVVIEASKNKKILATMRKKKEREFMAAAEKQEQKDIDELVAARYTARERRTAGE